MARLKLTTFINAPVERCFDLSRSIDLHLLSMATTGEQAIAGKTRGLIAQGETVTWEAVHFGIRQRLTTTITEMNYPDYFIDEMTEGAFKSMRHLHKFDSRGGGTVMTDEFHYETPFGILGRLFDGLVLARYMTTFLAERNKVIKRVAESDEWKNVLE